MNVAPAGSGKEKEMAMKVKANVKAGGIVLSD